MLRAALKQHEEAYYRLLALVPTHTMLRAALKPLNLTPCHPEILVPTHIMLRAALKQYRFVDAARQCNGPDTHNAVCGIETAFESGSHDQFVEVPTHIMPRAALKPLRCLM